jgi:hypothetical protein
MSTTSSEKAPYLQQQQQQVQQQQNTCNGVKQTLQQHGWIYQHHVYLII